MNAAAAVRRAIPILAQHGTIDRGILRAFLIRGGLSRVEAAHAVRFVPLALGRAILLGGMGMALSDSYLLVNGEERTEKRLADEPFFAETLKLAPRFSIDIVSAVAMQSSEVQAVNEALHAGAQPEHLVASMPVVVWEDGIDNAPSKPRWRFWG